MSPLLLGILNSQAAGGGAGAYDHIETINISSTTSSVTLSSIPQNYDHLQLMIFAKGSSNSSYMDNVILSYNNNSSYIYTNFYYASFGATTATSGGTGYNQVTVNGGMCQIGDSNVYAGADVQINDYASTSKWKTTRSTSGGVTSNDSWAGLQSHLFKSTDAITSIVCTPGAGSFVSGSYISLYGWGG